MKTHNVSTIRMHPGMNKQSGLLSFGYNAYVKPVFEEKVVPYVKRWVDVYRNFQNLPGNTAQDKVNNVINNAKTLNAAADKIKGIKSIFTKIDPATKRALITALGIGALPVIFGSGTLGERLSRSIGLGALGGLGMYGASKLGYYDAAKTYATEALRRLSEESGN